jgi:hypothetical protein
MSLSQFFDPASIVIKETALRPVMHTFFQPILGGCCEMTEEGHRSLIKAWERAWHSFGWDTNILHSDQV